MLWYSLVALKQAHGHVIWTNIGITVNKIKHPIMGQFFDPLLFC